MSPKNISIVAAAALVAVLVYWFGFRESPPAKPKEAPVVQAPVAPSVKTKQAPKTASQGSSNRNVEVNYQDDPEGSLRLEGQVITTEDDPVAGAMVALDSRPPRFTKTDEDGSFYFDKLVARNYDIVAQAEEGAAGPVTARLSETNDPVILVLRSGGTVRVRVLEAGGGELADANVELRGIAVQTATTDASGLAAFAQVPVSRYDVVASAPGFAPQRSAVVVSRAGAAADVSLTLRAGAKVSGVVLGPEGKPVAGAHVLYRGASDWSVRADARLDHVLSAADGSFAIAALPRGSFRFVADAKNYAQGSSDVVALDGESETTGVEIRMEPSAVLRGRVLSAAGTPVAAARVRVAVKGSGMVRGGGVRQAYTDEEGKYEIRELRRKLHEVVALHESASSEIVSADLSKAPHDVELAIALAIDGVIAGVVVDSNEEPVAGAQVTLFPDFQKGGGRSSSEWRMRGFSTELTDAGGKFRVSGLAVDANYRVRAVPGTSNNPGRAWLSEGTPARTGDEDVRIVLPADGGIRGKVTLANGEAPELFTVSVGWQRGTPFSSEDGSFELSDLPPKTFTVVISGPGIDEARVEEVVVTEGVYTDIGSITATKGRSISGTVVDLEGSPVAGAKVSAGRVLFGDGSSSEAGGRARNPMARATKTVTSGEDGGFSIYGVVSGDLSIVADHETVGRSLPISVVQTSDSIRGISLQLQKTGALEGIVTKNGEPEDGVVVTATSVRHPGVTFNVASGVDGSYRFDRLVADEYRVKAMFGANPMSGMSYFAEKSSVVADATTALNIDFDDGGATIRVILSAEGELGFTWLSIVGPGIAAKTARDLQTAQGGAMGFEGSGMSIRGGPANAKNVPAGSYSLCALVYPSEVSGMEKTFAYMERQGDNLPAQCQPLKVPEGSTEMEVQMSVVIPEFVPDPNANTAPEAAPETAP